MQRQSFSSKKRFKVGFLCIFIINFFRLRVSYFYLLIRITLGYCYYFFFGVGLGEFLPGRMGFRMSWALVLLRILVSYCVVLAQVSGGSSSKVNGMIFLLLLRLILCFISERALRFYVYYEFRALGVFMLVVVFGYQPERIIAGILVMLFTVVSSLPLIVFILWGEGV